jgi:hypothetical protein
MSFVLFNLNDIYAKAKKDAEAEAQKPTPGKPVEGDTAPEVQHSVPVDIPKVGTLTSAAKVYPTMVDDERWFEEPWQLIQFRDDKSEIVSLSQAQLIAAHMPLRCVGGLRVWLDN